jgi:hypothetical protein
LAIWGSVFPAFVSQERERAKAEFNQLVVDRIKLAHRRDMKEGMSKHLHVALKGALGGDQFADKPSSFGIMDVDAIEGWLCKLLDELFQG